VTKHLTRLAIATLGAIALFAGVGVRLAHAAAGDIYNLGTLGGSGSGGYDINDAGQVVGYADEAGTGPSAFLWDSSHGMTDLVTATGYIEARAYAINASGAVVGAKDDNGTGFSHAFVWTPNEPNGTTGTFTSLARDVLSEAADINAAGQVVGSSANAYFVDDGSCTPDSPYYPNCGPGGTWVVDEPSPVLWENAVGTELAGPGVANAINNAGQVVGYNTDGHAFRYDGTPGSGGIIHDLGTLGGRISFGHAINNLGQVVGDSWTADNNRLHAFRYTGTPGAGGLMVDLDVLGGTYSHAYDINEAGFVVGEGSGLRATLWQNDAGNTAVDLDAWLDAINPTLGAYWDLFVARAINNDGLITGTGYYYDGPGGLSDGPRAFVLDASSLVHPIPGDFNNNGSVDTADYVVWRKGLGTIYTQDHYNVWRANFGRTAGSGVSANAAVPEPTTLIMLVVALIGCSISSARQSHKLMRSWHVPKSDRYCNAASRAIVAVDHSSCRHSPWPAIVSA
jgi:probable HAF family extracellular repeat protein